MVPSISLPRWKGIVQVDEKDWDTVQALFTASSNPAFGMTPHDTGKALDEAGELEVDDAELIVELGASVIEDEVSLLV